MINQTSAQRVANQTLLALSNQISTPALALDQSSPKAPPAQSTQELLEQIDKILNGKTMTVYTKGGAKQVLLDEEAKMELRYKLASYVKGGMIADIPENFELSKNGGLYNYKAEGIELGFSSNLASKLAKTYSQNPPQGTLASRKA